MGGGGGVGKCCASACVRKETCAWRSLREMEGEEEEGEEESPAMVKVRNCVYKVNDKRNDRHREEYNRETGQGSPWVGKGRERARLEAWYP